MAGTGQENIKEDKLSYQGRTQRFFHVKTIIAISDVEWWGKFPRHFYKFIAHKLTGQKGLMEELVKTEEFLSLPIDFWAS